MPRQDFRNEPKVRLWENRVRDAGCTIAGLKPLSLLNKKNGELLFALCEADVTDPSGRTLPGYVFIRGHAAIVVPLLINEETGERKFLMIRQRRIGNGALNLEFPAGMLDREVDAAQSVAARELREETGLALAPDILVPLHHGPLYSSPGADDEGIYFFGCVVFLSGKDSLRLRDGQPAASTKEKK